MRILSLTLSVCLVGCTANQDIDSFLVQSQRSLAIEVGGAPLFGTVVWWMSAPEFGPASDSLHIDGIAVAAPSAESKLHHVTVDVPLRGLGQWKDSTLAVAYGHQSYRDAPDLGVAQLFKASIKSWQLPSSDGTPAGSSTELEPTADFIDGFDRYVVRAINLRINSTGNTIAGTITLSPDNGQLPSEFDTALDLEMKIEGSVQSFGCHATRVAYVTETGVAVLELSSEFAPACLARFHLE